MTRRETIQGRVAIAERREVYEDRVRRGVVAAYKVSVELYDPQMRPMRATFYTEDIEEEEMAGEDAALDLEAAACAS